MSIRLQEPKTVYSRARTGGGPVFRHPSPPPSRVLRIDNDDNDDDDDDDDDDDGDDE